MLIYVICGECGAAMQKLGVSGEIVGAIAIEVEEGVVAEVVRGRCARCSRVVRRGETEVRERI